MNILIIDDQTLLRTGFGLFLAELSSSYRLFEAADLATAAAIIGRNDVIDLVISEIRIDGVTSAEIVKLLKSFKTEVPILFYSVMPERLFALPALRAGADGFIMKRAKPAELAKAIAVVGAGGKYMSVELQASLLPMLQSGYQAKVLESVELLSQRERVVMNQVVQGKSTKEIAFLLNVKCNTISTYKKRIYRKMNVSDTFELSQKASGY